MIMVGEDNEKLLAPETSRLTPTITFIDSNAVRARVFVLSNVSAYTARMSASDSAAVSAFAPAAAAHCPALGALLRPM